MLVVVGLLNRKKSVEREINQSPTLFMRMLGELLFEVIYVFCGTRGDITGALCIMTSGPTDATESRAHFKKNNRDREHSNPWGGLTKSEMHMEGREMKLLH